MRVVYAILFVISAWKWGGWRNWRHYYDTILFMIAVNLFSSILTHNHTLWRFNKSWFLEDHMVSNLFITFVSFPATVLIYLHNFPKERTRQIIYVFLWVLLYTVIETVSGYLGMISYQNGWSLAWSVLLDCIMFPVLIIHHRKPWAAWAISIVFIIFIWMHFDFSPGKLKQ